MLIVGGEFGGRQTTGKVGGGGTGLGARNGGALDGAVLRNIPTEISGCYLLIEYLISFIDLLYSQSPLPLVANIVIEFPHTLYYLLTTLYLFRWNKH